MKIIDMSSAVGSDTLLQSTILESKYDYFKADHACDLIRGVRVAENIWQSTANNLVIPEGLVCDVEWFTDFEEGLIITIDCLSGEGIKDLMESPDCHIVAIKVTGKQEGWCYEWEKGE